MVNDYRKLNKHTNADALSRIELNPLETESMIVNIDDEELEELLHTDENIRLSAEEIENIINDLEGENDLLDTINSNMEDGPPNSIPIQEEVINNKQQQIHVKTVHINPHNNKQQQIHVKTVHINPQPVKFTIKDGKTIYRIQIPKTDNSKLIQDFMKGYLQPNRKYYIMFDLEETYKQLAIEIFNKLLDFFSHYGIPKSITMDNGTEFVNLEDEEKRNELIKNHYKGKTNHRGITETISYLQGRYCWNKMDTHVTNYINKCEVCKTANYDRNPPKLPLNLTEIYEKPFEKVHIDTFSLQDSDFLTIVDAFTKIGQAYHIEGKTAIEIFNKLLDFFSHYGIPKSITMDNGTEFVNRTIQSLLRDQKIQIHTITPHNPQSNGIVERFHETLEHFRIPVQEINELIPNLMKYYSWI
ncbi:Integrase zinc binding domain [Popillia japonica]|uniref:RNA-directed DNA polymerase n=1 Tax=Popillia japonica TaxID=7064 RepID=A0AAW1IFG6_POPJA